MKKYLLIWCAWLIYLPGLAQARFDLVAPQTVMAGESFRVQYLASGETSREQFLPPVFTGFRVVSGPDFYEGQSYNSNGPEKISNIVYTLVGTKPGLYEIPGASIRVNDQWLKGKAQKIEVVPTVNRNPGWQKADDYFLGAGEDPYQKIARNLFVRVAVDRRSCYVGQPVVATFKLYSTLESRSDIVKNPGLYGFTVLDIIGLQDNRVSREIIGGKKFDVHTIRQVQMYPLRAGVFEVDPMEVTNKVEFYTDASTRTPQQRVREGVLPDELYEYMPNRVVFESSMSTERVAITVKPTPEGSRPDSFNGAVGKFRISAAVLKPVVQTNEEGILEVRISGAGNFPQLTAPEINWPAGITGFEPEVKDQLDQESSPLRGERLFRYHFLAARTGQIELAPVSISFFNPDSNRYHTISSPPISISIIDSLKTTPGSARITKSKAGSNWFYWVLSGILALLVLALCWWLWKGKRSKKIEAPDPVPVHPSVDEVLKDARLLSVEGGDLFCPALNRALWSFFSGHLQLRGSQLNQRELASVLRQRSVGETEISELFSIMDHCATGMFTNVYGEEDQEPWIGRASVVLKKIEPLIESHQ